MCQHDIIDISKNLNIIEEPKIASMFMTKLKSKSINPKQIRYVVIAVIALADDKCSMTRQIALLC